MRMLSHIVSAPILCLILFMGINDNVRAQEEVAPRILLQKATDFLKFSKNLDLEVDIDFDLLLSPSLVAQYSGKLKVKMSRPNRLFVGYEDSRESKILWLDGQNVTYVDVLTGHFAKVPGKKTVEESTFDLYNRYGVALPLANLLFTDASEEIMRGARSVNDLGKVTLSGKEVHHIAVHGETTDIQIWIDGGNEPLVHKLIIINRALPLAPRYVARFRKFDRPADIPESVFTPVSNLLTTETKILAIEEVEVDVTAN